MNARKIIVGVAFVIIAALLGYYGRNIRPVIGCPNGCPAGLQCVNNSCVLPAGVCSTAAQCMVGQFCYGAKCQTASGTCAPACVPPLQCVNSVCQPVT